jgi:hypothetical protein
MGDGDELDSYSSTPAEGHSVCSKCFDDEDIEAFIESLADSQACDFCRRKSRTRPIAAPLEAVVEFIFRAINREYERAVDALGWDSSEGGYQGLHWDSLELLVDQIGLDLPNDNDGRLLEALYECLGDEVWCQRDPYSLRKDERLIGSWKEFCDFIKHRRRYFFLQQSEERSRDLNEYLAPSELLGFIGSTVQEHALVRELAIGSLIYRARRQKPREVLDSPYDFGPPPVECATRSNRMSPAGIVMFYGSDDWETAVAEIDDAPRSDIAVGTFRTTRAAKVLDLTRLPRRLRFFEQQPDSSLVDRYALDFLHSFVLSLAAKVEPGEREYVDYVPTQVVTEWFRTSFLHEGMALDGIRYPSAQRTGGKSLVLFANQFDVVLSPKQIAEVVESESTEEWWVRTRHRNAWLKLVRKRMVQRPQV